VSRQIIVLACMALALVTPARAATPALTMQVTVHPSPLRTDSTHAYIQVATQPSIICVAFVLYDNGLLPLTFPHARTEVTSIHGIATWAWSDPPRAAGGTASVSCTIGSTTRTVNVHFQVLPDSIPHQQARGLTQLLAVRGDVTPNPMPATGTLATLTAHTAAGARCVAGIFYNDGKAAPAFVGYPQVAATGVVSWHWHAETASTGGTATVSCAFQGKSGTATALFTIKRP
jgi:hypothetical protein